MNPHLKVLAKLQKQKKSKSPWKPESYVGGSHKHLNLSIPTVRLAFKAGFGFENNFANWNQVWKKSDTFEVMTCSLMFLSTLPDKGLTHLKQITTWSDRVDNWAHADGLSHFYSIYLEENPKIMLPILKKWNASSNPWKVRLSIVSLFYYSRMRKKQPSFSLAMKFIKPHISHSHIYVQKGIGWTLRECYNVYPRETLDYVFKNVKLISPTAWYATTEKLPLPVKQRLMKLRKG